MNKNRLVSILNKQMFRNYQTLVRCSDADAEPRFDSVDWSLPPVETSNTRRGVVGCGLTTLGGVVVLLSMIKSERAERSERLRQLTSSHSDRRQARRSRIVRLKHHFGPDLLPVAGNS
jgi:hypothetical protein